MTKGNDKKPKADVSKPKSNVSAYKAAQSVKPANSPFLQRKPGK